MTETKNIDYSFDWEDGGSAMLRYFICSCGHREYYNEVVDEETIIECPSCKRKYSCVWQGMILKEVK